MRKQDLEDKGAVQAAVRQVAEAYLDDPNITSVGIGHKLVDGERTDELALQFTVAEKVVPESLKAVPTREIPETITANGIVFATDVVERVYETNRRLVEGPGKPPRKRRIDPVLPGASIGHVESTAGTLGCLVRENESGAVRVLSNWHVLQGEGGRLGDAIVQPGPFDDNRVAENRCGRLIRSFLGLAGDCALASIEGRGAAELALGLDVAVRELADPELDDRVVKSGRTTDVTYGVVTRVHTITELTYGRTTTARIGGFEIGPDPEQPARDGEISSGGDSGAAWMAVDGDGAATEVMLGLHFAGEGAGQREHALACYASSVFAKLEISPLAAGDTGSPVVVEHGPLGYDQDFLPGMTVAVPAAANDAVADDFAPTTDGDLVRHCTHFSLAMSRSRRFCRWVAWNVDGNGLQQLSRDKMKFRRDPAYDAEFQTGNALYADNRLDRGHIARRADLLWGSRADAEQANEDSFLFTNITPQLDDFNQSHQHGLWGRLEDAIYEDVSVDDLRLSVFGGPLFTDTDFAYRGLLVPRSFWKLIAYVEAGALKAKAYVLTQDDLESKLEALGLEPFQLFQVPVATLSAMSGLDFGALAAADTLPAVPEALGGVAVRRVDAYSQIVAN